MTDQVDQSYVVGKAGGVKFSNIGNDSNGRGSKTLALETEAAHSSARGVITVRMLCCPCYPFHRTLAGKLASMCVFFAIPLSAWAEERFMYWQGETPPASGVGSAQWFFDPDSWVGGIYPGNSALPPGVQIDTAIYQFHPDVTPDNDTWIVQLGNAGPTGPASHAAAQVHPGNWVFRFEQPGAPGAPPLQIGTYTLTGYPSNISGTPHSFRVGSSAGVTNLAIEGQGTGGLFTNETFIAFGDSTIATVTLSDSTWHDAVATIIGVSGTGSLSLESGSQLTTGFISLGQGVNPGGHGTLTISDSSTVSATYSHIASLAGASGDAIITGDNSEWTNSSEVVVGYGGDGTLRIEDGGTVTNLTGYVGFDQGSIGIATVTGAGSEWNSIGSIIVGNNGTASLRIEDGGTVTNLTGYVGFDQGSIGIATVTGAGSEWNSIGSIIVGNNGTANGTLRIEAGGAVHDTNGYVGYENGSVGTATVTGAGSIWHSTDGHTVGFNSGSNGTLRIEAGGRVSNVTSFIGVYSGSTGAVTVTDAGSTWESSGSFIIGNNGTASLRIEDGGTVTNLTGYVGFDQGSIGIATVTGAGSEWNSIGSIIVGNLDASNGTLTIEAGGNVSDVTGYVGFESGSFGSVVVRGTDSAWINSGQLRVGDKGIGELLIDDGATVANVGTGVVGSDVGATGTVTVTGPGSAWINSNALIMGVDGNGSLLVDDGGMVSNTLAWIGPRSGSTGSVTVSGPDSRWVSSYLAIANDGSEVGGTGTLIVRNGGSVEVGSRMRIASTATVDLDNGSLAVRSPGPNNHDFRIVDEAPSDANVTIRNGGSLEITENAVAEINGNVEISTTGSMTLSGQTTTAIRGTLRLVGNENVATVTVQDNATLIVDELEDVRFDNLTTVGLNSTVRLNAMTLGGTQTPPALPTVLSGNLQIGHAEGSGGTSAAGIEVRGGATQDDWPKVLNVGNELAVGFNAPGVFKILQGGEVNSNTAAIAKIAGSIGTVVVEQRDAGFPGPRAKWNIAQRLYVGGDALQPGGTAMLDVDAGGVVTAGERLHVGPLGTVQVGNFDARVIVGGDVFDDGTDGAVEVFEGGALSGSGQILADVINHGLVAPGASAGRLSIAGDFNQDDGTLAIEIGGLAAGTQFDQLDILGEATLGGSLAIELVAFNPALGDQFELIAAGAGITGTFDEIDGANDLVGTKAFVLDYEANSVRLVVTLPGDANLDFSVDGSDFGIWNAGKFTSGGGWGAGDFNFDGVTDGSDFGIWNANKFTSIVSTLVPEPSTIIPLVVTMLWRRHRRRDSSGQPFSQGRLSKA